MPNDFKFLTMSHMVCFRHKITRDKHVPENRLVGIFEKKPVSPTQDIVVFADPPVEPGNCKILTEYKKGENEIHLPVSTFQDFDVRETITMMEKQLSAAVEKGYQVLQAAKGINISQKRDLLYRSDRAGK